jgi:4-amino-4-deoxy-L-arabinose transferase-like glycosyltransferase
VQTIDAPATPATPAVAAGPGLLAAPVAWARRRPDLAIVALLLLVGAGMRLAFGLRAPPLFVGGDSQTYLVPAWDLANGLGFAPILKRPPLYPLFVAGAFVLMGEDPHGLAFLQHGLGLATVALTYFLARAAFNRLAGAVAGLLVALNGPLIIYERYVMAETLMTTLLAAAALALVVGMQRASWRLYALGGLLLALAALSRAAAQLLLPLVPLVALAWHRRPGTALRLSGAALAGFALPAVPFMLLTFGQTGSLGASGLGEALFWRGTRETPVLISREVGRPAEVADPTRQAARRLAYQRASQEQELPSDTAVLLQQRFGLTEAQADGILREVAVELFARQPELYVQTSLALFGELLVGTEQWLGGQGKGGGTRKWPNPAEKYDDWWNEKVRHLALPPTTAQANEFRRAQAVANVFQPFRHAPLLLGLLAAGIVAAVLLPRWRAGLLPALMALWLLLSTAFLSGALPRYRYPADPLLACAIGGGVALLALGAARLLRTARRPARPVEPTTATSAPAPARPA